jgi:hypothetical protein
VDFQWISLKEYNDMLGRNLLDENSKAFFLSERTLNSWNCVWAMCVLEGTDLLSFGVMTSNTYYIVTP